MHSSCLVHSCISSICLIEKMFPVLQLTVSGFGTSLEPAFLDYIRALPIDLLTVPPDKATEGTGLFVHVHVGTCFYLMHTIGRHSAVNYCVKSKQYLQLCV